MVTRDIIQRLLGVINDTRARLNTLESREVALLTATQTLTNKTLTTPTIGNFTNAQHAHTGATSGGTISHSSLTDLTTGDPHTQYLLESVYDANTILKADADDTPIALTVGASTIVGRASTGDIAALTASQVATIVQGSIDHSQLTNLTTGDPHTQYLLESVYDANTILKADADDTPIALTVGASTIVGRASTGDIAALTASQVATIVQGSIDHSQLTNLTTGDPHTQYLLETTYDANTILKADADNTPVALTIGASTIVGRASTGNIAALTAAQVATIVQGSIDHGSIAGLADDDHTGYARLTGRSGGQTLIGGTAANDDLTLEGTSNATRTTSYVVLQPNGGNVGIGTTSPTARLEIRGAGTTSITTALEVDNSSGNPLLVVKNDGAATFSSTVTAAQFSASSNVTAGIFISQGATNYGLIAMGENATSAKDIFLAGVVGYSNGFGVQYTGSAMRYYFLDGNVGIGTTSPSRGLHVAGTILIDGDEGGIAGTIGLTDVSDATLGSANGTVKVKGTTARDSAGFIKMYVGTTTVWVPYWTNIS